MFFAPFTCAFVLYPHASHSNVCVSFLFLLSTYPHLLHVCDVYAGFTSITSILQSSCNLFNLSLNILLPKLLISLSNLLLNSVFLKSNFSTIIVFGLYISISLFIYLLISFFRNSCRVLTSSIPKSGNLSLPIRVEYINDGSKGKTSGRYRKMWHQVSNLFK